MSKLVRDMDFGEGGGTTNVVKQRLLLMLDEFPQLRKMEQIENQLAICAGYGVKICIVAQNIGQLNQLYTKENGIAANCHVQIYFTPADNDSARMLSDKLGDATITTNSVSSSGKLFENNTSVSENARKLMTPDEASRMDEEKELVFVTGKRPIFADKIRFYKEPYFVKRVSFPIPVRKLRTMTSSLPSMSRNAGRRKKSGVRWNLPGKKRKWHSNKPLKSKKTAVSRKKKLKIKYQKLRQKFRNLYSRRQGQKMMLCRIMSQSSLLKKKKSRRPRPLPKRLYVSAVRLTGGP